MNTHLGQLFYLRYMVRKIHLGRQIHFTIYGNRHSPWTANPLYHIKVIKTHLCQQIHLPYTVIYTHLDQQIHRQQHLPPRGVVWNTTEEGHEAGSLGGKGGGLEFQYLFCSSHKKIHAWVGRQREGGGRFNPVLVVFFPEEGNETRSLGGRGLGT